MKPETRNQKLLRELNEAADEISAWGHAHTFLAGLSIGLVVGFVLKWAVF